MPLVSVVIPCYRGTRYLDQAVESCLRQTHGDLEVIVVDDASPDGDAEVADALARSDDRVRVVRRAANGGVSRALNSGFAAARGDLLARLAQDDMFREDALEVMAARLAERPDCGLAYCDMQLVDADGRFLQMMPTEEPARALLPAQRAGLCLMWRRAAWERVGPFDPRFDTADDYEFLLRLSRTYPLAKVAGAAPFFMRYHPDQGSRRFERRQDLAIVMAQAAHHWAIVRRHPGRLAHWKPLATSRVRVWHRRARLALGGPDGYRVPEASTPGARP